MGNIAFVTGATGILGRIIVFELLKRGRKVRAARRISSDLHEVRISLRCYSEQSDMYFNRIEWVTVDFDQQSSLRNALQGVEEVYHCAAKVSYDPADRKEIYHTNVSGTQSILRACKYSNIKKFLYIGSSIIFDSEKDGYIDEKSPLISSKNNTDYAISKVKANREVCKASAEGLNTIVLNPGMIIGSGNWQSSSGELLQILISRFYTFSGGAGWVDVRDAAKIAVELMDKNAFGEQFLIASGNLRYRDIARIAKMKQHKNKPFVLSGRIMHTVCFFKPFLGWLFPELRLLTKANIEFLSSFQKVAGQKIVKKLNYHFIGIEECLSFHVGNFIHR